MGAKQSVNNDKFIGTFHGPLSQKYEILKQLGAGAQGAAYLVRAKASGDQYVAKETHDMTPEGKEDFIEEFKKMRALRHPNCTKVIEMVEGKEFIEGEWKEQIYVISELAKGSDLYKYMKKAIAATGSMSEEWVAGVFKQAMQGVAYIHSKEIVHNDLKPDNILMMEDFHPNDPKRMPAVAINDFGCATLKKDCGPKYGDPRYQSPEAWTVMLKMLAEEPVGITRKLPPKSDVWSMAATLYELLSGGKLAFLYKQCTLHEILESEDGLMVKMGEAIVNDPLEVRPHCKGISQEAESLLKIMFEKDLEQRPSAQEVLKHEWFSIKGHNLDSSTTKSIEFSATKGVAHRILLNALASKLQRSHYQACWDIFSSMDKDQSGHISMEEFVGACQKLGKDTSDAETVFKQADIDGGGEMDFQEFIAATFDWKSMGPQALEQNLQHLIADLDQDGNGEIDKKEFASVFQGVLPKSEVNEVFQRIDIDGSGMVSAQEMKRFLFEPATEEELAAMKVPPPPPKSEAEVLCGTIMPIAVGGGMCYCWLAKLL